MTYRATPRFTPAKRDQFVSATTQRRAAWNDRNAVARAVAGLRNADAISAMSERLGRDVTYRRAPGCRRLNDG